MTPTRALLFLCGQLGIMLLARFFFQWIILYSSQPLPANSGEGGGALTLFSAAAVGAALLGFRIFDGVTDPIAGALSDLWVARGRARRTLLWIAAPLPALGLALCFAPTAAFSEGARWALLITGMFVFFVGYTVYAIPYWSLSGDYARSEGDSKLLSTLLGAGLLLASAVGFVLTPFIVAGLGYADAALVIAAVSVPLMIAPYFAAPPPTGGERPHHIDPSLAPNSVGIGAVLGALQDKRFRASLFLFGGSQMSLTVMTSAAPFLAIHLLGGTMGDVARLLGPLLGVAIPASICVPALSRRLGWERGVAWSCALLALVYMGVGALGVNLISSPMVTAMIIFALGGPMIAALLGLEAEAITDCAEAERARLKARGEEASLVGVYFGVYNLVVKACNGVAIALAGALAGVVAQGGESAIWGARAMGVSAGAMLLIGLALYALLRPRGELSAQGR
jgi:GPH family glycoside/pentoside/hexuronide:cation symporter